jgi:multimeric flavodoxin WrbA
MALEAARAVDPRVRTELVDLGGKRIAGWSPAIEGDDFDALLPLLRAENLGGFIIGSPVYFRTMSALCKAFLERLAVLRAPQFALADKPVGALTVGAYRNGGQELVINEILSVMLCHEMAVVGGRAPAFQGATLLNENDSISADTLGMESARLLGRRVAEAAVRSLT